jgi:non-heme chloroperoxidase
MAVLRTGARSLPASIHTFALTQRGHGDASRPAAGYSVNDFADDVAAFMEALHLGAGIIVGHSMSSAVTLRFAIDHPDRTGGLVLVGASPTMAGPAAARAFWDSTVSKLTDPVDPRLVREMTESMLVKHVPRAFVDAAVQEGSKVPAHVWRAVFQSRWNLEGDFSGQLGMIKTPTLIVWGDQDGRYGRTEQEALASAISGSRLIVFQGRDICSTGRTPNASRPISLHSSRVFSNQYGRVRRKRIIPVVPASRLAGLGSVLDGFPAPPAGFKPAHAKMQCDLRLHRVSLCPRRIRTRAPRREESKAFEPALPATSIARPRGLRAFAWAL